MKMSQNDLDFSVVAALSAMELTETFMKFVKDNRELWLTFGKMDSSLYRKKLMRLMKIANLNAEQRLVVHFLFAVVKKKSRVIDGLNALPDGAKSMAWYEPVRTFIAGTITDYNTSAKAPDKFPGTHIPTTNPGLDLLMWRIMTPRKDRNSKDFFARTTSIQLMLDRETQDLAKSGYKYYWDEVVKGTRNTTKTEDSKYREEYYETSAGDTYLLVDDKLKEIPPKNKETGYTLKEIEAWIIVGE